jgi:hypothetical protein
MTTIDASHLSVIPFIDMKSVDGRFLSSSTFFDEGRWRLWTPVETGFIELKIIEPLEMLYFARSPASERDLYFHFLDFVAQRAAFPEVMHGFSGISDDVLNLTTVLSKVELLHSSREAVGHGITRMVTTEVEYLFSVCRSVFDLLQEIIARLWATIKLNDASIKKKPLKSSFNDMVRGQARDAGNAAKSFRASGSARECLSAFRRVLCRPPRDSRQFFASWLARSNSVRR